MLADLVVCDKVVRGAGALLNQIQDLGTKLLELLCGMMIKTNG